MTKRLMAKTGEYQKDGQTKGRYTEVGVVLSNANGEYVLLDPSVNLAGVLMQQQAMGKQGDRVMVSIFDSNESNSRKNTGYGNDPSGPRNSAGGSGSYNATPQTNLDDEIPF